MKMQIFKGGTQTKGQKLISTMKYLKWDSSNHRIA